MYSHAGGAGRWPANWQAISLPHLNFPGLTIGTGPFGQITSAGLGRVMQFGLRYEF
jgi:hypothetical protein